MSETLTFVGRVLVFPVKHRTVHMGGGTRSIAACIHGKLVHHPCATCEFEAPRLKGETPQ